MRRSVVMRTAVLLVTAGVSGCPAGHVLDGADGGPGRADAAAPFEGGLPLDGGPGQDAPSASFADEAAAPDAGTPGTPADAAPDEMPATDGNAALADGPFTDGEADAPTPVDVPRGPTWASWPMPNPASSGLPHPASYDTSVNGVVLDNVTHLMWQQSDDLVSASTMTAAAAYCVALRLAGYADWRLPSRIEAWSIQDFTRADPALDPVFSSMPASPAWSPVPWTSTPGYDSAQAAFTRQWSQSVDPSTGEASGGQGSTVRCVRGAPTQPSPHYTVNGGTVLDNGTGLTWQKGYDPLPSLPNGVANYCASLTLAGGGWRPPSVKELETLVDDTLYSPAIDTSVFSIVAGDPAFYSSSTWNAVPMSMETWYVNYDDGSNGTGVNQLETPIYPVNNLHEVRCVR
jgi:hypothetical protein